jgi:1-acyl-sn-glycerol-3-phosphate acyltransferase
MTIIDEGLFFFGVKTKKTKRLLRLLAKIYLRLYGWKAEGHLPFTLKKAVVVVAPHTSGRDVIVCIAFRKALNMDHVKFLGKQELFRPPFGFFFRWLGGIPVDRFHSTHLVDDVVKMFNSRGEFVLGLSPEGTRKKVDRLRTGFYHIARQAGVPIQMVGLDFQKHEMVFAEPFLAGNDEIADLRKITGFFGPVRGRHPELGMAHLMQG